MSACTFGGKSGCEFAGTDNAIAMIAKAVLAQQVDFESTSIIQCPPPNRKVLD
jgi:hypothetical protein